MLNPSLFLYISSCVVFRDSLTRNAVVVREMASDQVELLSVLAMASVPCSLLLCIDLCIYISSSISY